jgi:tetratricopeptide (TPR) repeat protein
MRGYETIMASMTVHTGIEAGRSMVAKGELTKAVEHYKGLLVEYPIAPQLYADLGTVYAMMKNFELSVSALKKGIELGAADAATYSALGTVLHDSGNPVEGLPYFQLAIKADPTYVFAYYNMAGALESLGKSEEALQALKKCKDLAAVHSDFANKVHAKIEAMLNSKK